MRNIFFAIAVFMICGSLSSKDHFKLISPMGGETIEKGNSYEIKFVASADNIKCDIEYYDIKSGSWKSISSGKYTDKGMNKVTFNVSEGNENSYTMVRIKSDKFEKSSKTLIRLTENSGKKSNPNVNTIDNPEPIKIFPNPSDNYITIDTKGIEIDRMKLISTSGSKIFEIDFKERIDISNLEPGTYFLRLFNQEKVYNKKLIILR